MNDAERLLRIEDAIARLREAADCNALVVEGPRDRLALETLGIGGTHIVVNSGASILTVADRIAEEVHDAPWTGVILLMDWDRTGNSLQDRLHKALAGRVPVDVGLRARLRRITHTSSVEEVPAELASLRRRVQPRP